MAARICRDCGKHIHGTDYFRIATPGGSETAYVHAECAPAILGDYLHCATLGTSMDAMRRSMRAQGVGS